MTPLTPLTPLTTRKPPKQETGLQRWRSPAVLAEGIGPFVMVFAGTGAVMVNELSDGAVTHLGGGHHWLYWVGPALGALLAVEIYRHLSHVFKDISPPEKPIS